MAPDATTADGSNETELHDTVDADVLEDVETHRIEATEKMIRQTIEDQASDLVDGWREIIQNGLDSPGSTYVELEYGKLYTVVRDNGQGEDLKNEDGVDLVTNLGETSKEDLLDAIGEFGVGLFQQVCQGRTALISGDHVLLYDYKELGLDVIGVPIEDAVETARQLSEGWGDFIADELDGSEYVDGFTVVTEHYEEQMPDYSWKWDNFEDDLKERFEFAEVATATRIYVDGDRISDRSVGLPDADHTHTEEFVGDEAGRVHIGVALGKNRDLTVYSNGVKVTDVEGYGLGGHVVTEENLDLNFARNEIKAGCPKWDEISQRLDEIRLNLFGNVSEKRLNQDAREYIATQMVERDVVDDFEDVAIFRTADESHVSLEDVQGRDQVATAPPGDDAADKLVEAYGMIVLDEIDPASQILIDSIETSDADSLTDDEDDASDPVGQAVEDTGSVDASEKAESLGMHTTHERLDIAELSPTQRQKLMIARELADRLGSGRKVYYGESDVAKAWTDGASKVIITDSSTTSNAWIDYVPELFRQLVHELAHRVDTTENDATHGRRYNQRYRNMMDDDWDVLSDVLSDIRANGLDHVVDQAPKY